MNDALGDRMKVHEDVTRTFLPRRTNTLIRIDGKAFHTLTKHYKKPFDDTFMGFMDETAIALCEEIQGCKMGYVQSDEISLWLTDYDDINTSSWFDGNIRKICSVSASVATAAFNNALYTNYLQSALEMKVADKYITDFKQMPRAHFDSRVWTVAELTEVANYFLWRSQDAARNSVQMVARSLYSHAELEGKNNSQLHDMIIAKGQNWNDLPSRYKCGRTITRKQVPGHSTINGEEKEFMRNIWAVDEMMGYNFPYWNAFIGLLAPKTVYK